MDPRFRFVGGRVCLDLAATLLRRSGPEPVELLGSPGAARRWLLAAGLDVTGTVDGALLDDLRALRESVVAVVSAAAGHAAPPEGDLDRINRNAAGEVPVPRLAWSAAGPTRATAVVTPRHCLTLLARDAVDLLTGPDADRVHQCGAGGCTIWFVDSSRGRPRRWCDARVCGNRERVAGHRARSRAADGPGAGP